MNSQENIKKRKISGWRDQLYHILNYAIKPLQIKHFGTGTRMNKYTNDTDYEVQE